MTGCGWKDWLKKLLIISLIFSAFAFLITVFTFGKEETVRASALGALAAGAVIFLLPALLGAIKTALSYLELNRECRYLHISKNQEINVLPKDLIGLTRAGLSWHNQEWFIAETVVPEQMMFSVAIFHRDYVDCFLKQDQIKWSFRGYGRVKYNTKLKLKTGRRMTVEFCHEKQRDDFSKWVRRLERRP